MGDRRALFGLGAACALLCFALPEREAHPGLYGASERLFDAMGNEPGWPGLYLLWEMALLQELGFALDLTECAATGAVEDLAYVSPKSGRAVSRASAGTWADRLLPLPGILLGQQADGSLREVLDGLQTTGYFLEHWLAPAMGDRPLPKARERLVTQLHREEERT